MKKWSTTYLKSLGTESYERFVRFQKNPNKLEDNTELRYALLDFIADFANWDNADVSEYLETSRSLTQAAHEAFGGGASTRPLVVDSFAGGGSIPLEALRVGADAFASDLNPIPVLLNSVALEYIPRFGRLLAEELRKWGEWVRKEAEKELARFYPSDPDGATPIAYLWARTIKCEGPNCGAQVPLIRSLWLARKPHRSVAMQLRPEPRSKCVGFQIIIKKANKSVLNDDNRVVVENPKFDGTVKGGSATCPCCGYTTPVASVREQLRQRRGGARDATLFCVVTTRTGQIGRAYRVATPQDTEIVNRAVVALEELEKESTRIPHIPNESLPTKGTLGFRVQNYGVLHWGDLYTPRQALTLATIARLVREAGKRASDETSEQAGATYQALLALSLSRLIGRVNALCWWRSQADQEKIEVAFSGQTVPMKWDFAEACPLTTGTAGWDDSYKPPVEVIERLAAINLNQGVVAQCDASNLPLPNESADAFVTDPPYYDAVPYGALSDFFYVWLKRSLPSSLTAFSSPVAPKDQECIVDEASGKDRAYFERSMEKAMAEGRRILSSTGIGVIVFAHKSTSGWEAQLQAMINAGWIVTGSWPIDTEMVTRLRARDSAALASSVHIVCRPREATNNETDHIGDWREVLHQLPQRMHQWLPRLAEEGVVGADAIFACLGPALEIFSRYSRVEKASGETVSLREYLEHVWAAVSKEALAMVFKGADASGFEEDARLTAMWLWTLSAGQNEDVETVEEENVEGDEEPRGAGAAPKGYVLEYDAARKISQGLGAHLESLTRLVEVKGDIARLLPVAERTRRLFGEDESDSPAKNRKKTTSQLQLGFIAELQQAEEAGNWGTKGAPTQGATVLDRVHQSMILFAAGRGEALRRFLVDEGAGRDERVWRLAQVLSFLYPKTSDEKRWIDGVLARKKGLGF